MKFYGIDVVTKEDSKRIELRLKFDYGVVSDVFFRNCSGKAIAAKLREIANDIDNIPSV